MSGGAVEKEVISNHLHFIWFGPHLPDFAQIAIASALRKNPGSTSILWHDGQLENLHDLAELRAIGLQLRLIDSKQLFTQVRRADASLPASKLEELYSRLTKPAARANVIRMVVLYLYGGVYLDTDTLSVGSLSKLRTLGAFCGEEPTLWPAGTALLDPRALFLGEVRRACSLLPRGYKLHNRLLKHYTMAANNAVLGARAGHPFLALMLTRATQVPEGEWTRRYRLGTHLLQTSLKEYDAPSTRADDQIEVMPTKHFYPLGPEISKHYFQRCWDPEARTKDLLSKETLVIHWYASVADLVRRDADFIRNTSNQNVYSHLCRQHVRDAAPELAPSAIPSLA